MQEIVLIKKQKQALELLRDNRTEEVLFGGGARGGKSWFGCTWVMMESFDKPSSQWMIAREELTKLRDTTLLTFFKVLKAYNVSDCFDYNASTMVATNKITNVKIFFREVKYIPSDPEFDRIGSYDLTGFFGDEVQQFHPKVRSVLKGRFSVLEGVRLDGTRWKTIPKAFYSCNPAKNWIYAEFVLPAKKGILSADKAFIPSLVTDNNHVSKDYIRSLEKADKITRERLLYGNFEYDDSEDKLFETENLFNAFFDDFKEDGSKYITADIALEGADRFICLVWHGYKIIDFKVVEKSDGKDVLLIIEDLASKHSIKASNIAFDADGLGGFLKGFLRGARPFHNGSRPLQKEKGIKENYQNLKTQCAYWISRRFQSNSINLSLLVDHRDEIVQELENHKKKGMDKDDRPLEMSTKKEVKDQIGRSPDFADAIFMRSIFEFKSNMNSTHIRGI